MKFIKYFMILFVCISCNNKNNQMEQNKYQILNLIYSDFSKQQMEFFAFPAIKSSPPSNYKYQQDTINYRKILNNKAYTDSLHKIVFSSKISKEDSLKKINTYIEKKENQQIFALDLKMERYHNIKGRKLEKNIIYFDKLYKEFINSKKIDSLDIHKILPKNNDSLIVFREELLKNKVGVEFGKFNVLISFSKVVFNNDYSKAIIIGTKGFSGTNFHSLIYFLEKQNGKWVKKFEQTL